MNYIENEKSFLERIKIKFNRRFAKTEYGKSWTKDNYWYNKIHDSNPLIHQNFINYLKEKTNVTNILEVGCGAGIYPIKMKDLFSRMQYTGIDISQSAIDYCKKNSQYEFICGDFIKMDLNKKYDLVYSHAVVDHVYDIDKFISKIIVTTSKYAYITSYRGYFPDLKRHKKIGRAHV